jgi:hypothetical protein
VSFAEATGSGRVSLYLLHNCSEFAPVQSRQTAATTWSLACSSSWLLIPQGRSTTANTQAVCRRIASDSDREAPPPTDQLHQRSTPACRVRRFGNLRAASNVVECNYQECARFASVRCARWRHRMMMRYTPSPTAATFGLLHRGGGMRAANRFHRFLSCTIALIPHPALRTAIQSSAPFDLPLLPRLLAFCLFHPRLWRFHACSDVFAGLRLHAGG